MQVACPKCGAEVGHPCVGRRGPRKSYHKERHTRAKPIRKPKLRSTGYVYFIEDSLTGLIKIGFTERYPSQRLRQLQTGAGGDLSLIGFVSGTIATERGLHVRFIAQNVRGEWFRREGEFDEWLREIGS